MLPQFGFAEFLLLAAAALIVVGPKDLPMMMRRLGQFVAKGRAMAREFQSAFDDIAKQAELDELRQEIAELKRNNALTDAQDSLKAVEADINAAVMRGDAPAEDKAAEAPERKAATDMDADGERS
ncbi:MAG: Sec-independent protein translocase protein TatB [Hyphomonadaceae bacterium]|nr:Sec-independent protein translocase protein TatB [Hyphomonadaceae bacterium]